MSYSSGRQISHSLDRLLALSPRYVMVTCLTHEDGVGGWGEWELEAGGGGSV